ncbi:hypothetical protein HK104_007625 [Borealophlyctis nickersoniae]|nr:hypothetical protein HK104_007625 [Borealophlyctis nickersoniae]
MASCCGWCYNHVKLVTNVYPTEAGEEGPKPSALSLLVYYAGSKPYKLPKIGSTLEKRLKGDVKRNKTGYIRVTLQIVVNLMSECNQHLNLFSKSILRIVNDVLNSPDPDLVIQATGVFVTFSSYHNHEGTYDTEFTDVYSQVLQKFCKLAAYETSDLVLQHKSRLSGLKGIQAIAKSNSFLANPRAEAYSEVMLPAILINIMDPLRPSTLGTRSSRSLRGKTPSMHSHRNSITDELITDRELEHTADGCLHELFGKTNVITLKTLMGHIWKYLDTNNEWDSKSYVVHLVKTLAAAVQPQHRYVLMSLLIERLNDENFAKSTGIKTTLVAALTQMISNGGGAVGLTVLELLETLVKHLQQSAIAATRGGESKKEEEVVIQDALINAIGSLSVHLAYPDQINDIVAYVANRLRLDAAVPQDGNAAQAPNAPQACTEIRRLHLRALAAVVTTRESQLLSASGDLNSKRTSVSRSHVSYELLVPMLQFLTDDNPGKCVAVKPCHKIAKTNVSSPKLITGMTLEIRIQFFTFFYKLMMLEALEAAYRNHFAPVDLEVLHRRLFEYATMPTTNPVDFVIVGNLFVASLKRYYIDELLRTVPIMFALHNLILDGKVANPPRQRALASMVIEYFGALGEFLNNADLKQYAAEVKQEHIDQRMWSPEIEVSYDAVAKLSTRTFSETEGTDFTSLQVVRIPLNKARLLQVLAEDPIVQRAENAQQKLAIDYVPGQTEEEGEFTLHRKPQSATVAHKTSKSGSLNLTVPSTKKNSRSMKTTSTAEIPPVTVRIDELKDALAHTPPSTSGNGSLRGMDPLDFEVGSVTKQDVQNLLQSISATVEGQRRLNTGSNFKSSLSVPPSSNPFAKGTGSPPSPTELRPTFEIGVNRPSFDGARRPSFDLLRGRGGGVVNGMGGRRNSESQEPAGKPPSGVVANGTSETTSSLLTVNGNGLKHATSFNSIRAGYRPKEPSLRSFT